MFEKDRVFYKNEDYTVRFERSGGCERYYLKFHGQTTDSSEQEVTVDVFLLYFQEFKKPYDKKRNERLRHIEDVGGDVDGYIIAGKLTVTHFEQDVIREADMDVVLRSCTPVQQKRFKLHHTHGYSLSEIAKMEKCDESAVRRSVSAVLKKLKNIF